MLYIQITEDIEITGTGATGANLTEKKGYIKVFTFLNYSFEDLWGHLSEVPYDLTIPPLFILINMILNANKLTLESIAHDFYEKIFIILLRLHMYNKNEHI